MKRIVLLSLLLALGLTTLAACSAEGPDQTSPQSQPPASSAQAAPSAEPEQPSE